MVNIFLQILAGAIAYQFFGMTGVFIVITEQALMLSVITLCLDNRRQ